MRNGPLPSATVIEAKRGNVKETSGMTLEGKLLIGQQAVEGSRVAIRAINGHERVARAGVSGWDPGRRRAGLRAGLGGVR